MTISGSRTCYTRYFIPGRASPLGLDEGGPWPHFTQRCQGGGCACYLFPSQPWRRHWAQSQPGMNFTETVSVWSFPTDPKPNWYLISDNGPHHEERGKFLMFNGHIIISPQNKIFPSFSLRGMFSVWNEKHYTPISLFLQCNKDNEKIAITALFQRVLLVFAYR